METVKFHSRYRIAYMNNRKSVLAAMITGLGVTIARAAEPFADTLRSTSSANDTEYHLAWVMVGIIIGVGATGLITALIAAWMRHSKTKTPEPALSFSIPRKKEESPALRKTQPIQAIPASVISTGTLEALQRGREIHELSHSLLQEVIHKALSEGLHEIENDLLREKIVRCVMGPDIVKLTPNQADALWGCVLSWDPYGDNLEKQTTDMLSWICDDSGNYDTARTIVEHSRHNIPVPEKLPLNSKTTLIFDNNPGTLLDEGASAAVFRAHIKGEQDVAVKISRLTDYGILKNTLSEYLLLRRAQGIGAIIRLHGAHCYHVGEEVFFYIVEELAQTTLDGEFERRKAAREPYSEKEVRDQIVRPFLQALEKLHERGILHRDLKPKNIYRVDGVYKMGDFEIAAYSRNESRALDTGTFAGSPAYTTAAALVGRYGPETDINALACISYMMLRGDLPAIEDAPGTSTLIRGIKGGASLTKDEELRQEKAKKAVQEWLIQKRGFVAQIQNSLRSTPFERFFIAPIMSQGLYTKPTPGAILTAGEALRALAQIELSENAQEARRKALALAEAGDFQAARKTLMNFDTLLSRNQNEKGEVSMHVMIGNTLKEIDELECNPPQDLVLPSDNAERFADGRLVDSNWRYYEKNRAVGHTTDTIGQVSRDDRRKLTLCPRIREQDAKSAARQYSQAPDNLTGRFRIPEAG